MEETEKETICKKKEKKKEEFRRKTHEISEYRSKTDSKLMSS